MAPVGSLYFLFRGASNDRTKDIDMVVFTEGLDVAPLRTLERIGHRLGDIYVTGDKAVVRVTDVPGIEDGLIELVRGRTRPKGGFFPHVFLRHAAQAATMDGQILVLRLEHVLALRADAAVDRELRALRDPDRAEEHRLRARAFRANVFNGIANAEPGEALDGQLLAEAIQHLKQDRQDDVRQLFRAAGAELPEGDAPNR